MNTINTDSKDLVDILYYAHGNLIQKFNKYYCLEPMKRGTVLSYMSTNNIDRPFKLCMSYNIYIDSNNLIHIQYMDNNSCYFKTDRDYSINDLKRIYSRMSIKIFNKLYDKLIIM